MATKNEINKTRILIVDDHQILVDGLTWRLNFEDDFEVCGNASNVVEGLEQIDRLKPDLVVIDLSLKNSDGLDLVKDIHVQYEKLPTIVLSMHDEIVYGERVVRAGAKGYIMKDQSFDTVVDAIRQVLKGETYLSPAVKDHILSRMTNLGPNTQKASTDLLTDRELQVFRLIGQGMRPRHIAEKLSLSSGTIDTHCKRIRLKLDLAKMADVVEYAAEWLKQESKGS